MRSLLLGALVLVSVSVPLLAAPEVNNLSAVVQDPRLKESLYPLYRKIASEVGPTGALGSINRDWEKDRRRPWFIEQQRHAGDLMEAGIALHDPYSIQQSIKAIQWGLDQMKPDGGYDCGDPVHSTELFLEAAARGATLLRQTNPIPNAEQIVDAWTPKLRQVSRWLIERRKHQSPKERFEQLERYNHRFFASAAGIGMTAALLNDPGLTAAAEHLAREGLAKEQPGNIFPENGGFDTNYQTLCALMASRYYWSCSNPELRAKVGQALARALVPIMDRTAVDGAVDSSGTTRTSGQETARNGKIKQFGYREYFQALVTADHIQPSGRLEETIRNVIPQLARAAH